MATLDVVVMPVNSNASLNGAQKTLPFSVFLFLLFGVSAWKMQNPQILSSSGYKFGGRWEKKALSGRNRGGKNRTERNTVQSGK